jgi:hypothetical protein
LHDTSSNKENKRLMGTTISTLDAGQLMATERPTTHQVFLGDATGQQQDLLEREFFGRVVLPNGTVKSTNANRMNDLNATVLPYVQRLVERPVHIMDVGISSGVSTVEWYDQLSGAGVVCEMLASDLTVYASLLTLGSSFGALIDRHRNILHLDILGRGAPPSATGVQGIFAAAVRLVFRVAMAVDRSLPPLRGQTQEAATGMLLKCEPVSLLTKKMTQQSALQVIEDDLVAGDRPEFKHAFQVIRAANILNRAYFADATLVQMLNKLKNRLVPEGILIVCRTNDEGINNGTIFRQVEGGKVQVLTRIGSGSEIEALLPIV